MFQSPYFFFLWLRDGKKKRKKKGAPYVGWRCNSQLQPQAAILSVCVREENRKVFFFKEREKDFSSPPQNAPFKF